MPHPRNRRERFLIGKWKAHRRVRNHSRWPEHTLIGTIIGRQTLRNTTKVCSSYCCGNQRKWFHELTIPEKKVYWKGKHHSNWLRSEIEETPDANVQ